MTDETNTNQAQSQVPETEATAEAKPPEPDPLAALTAERDRIKDQLLRTLADFDNYRKRARRDAEEMARKAREDTLREMLPVFDNLERATKYLNTDADPKAIARGVEMVLRLFEDTITKLGGKRIPTVGQPFDPTIHEAIAQVESAEQPAGTIVREELAGYLLGDRLLRPAMVVVSKGQPGGGESAPAGGSKSSEGSGAAST